VQLLNTAEQLRGGATYGIGDTLIVNVCVFVNAFYSNVAVNTILYVPADALLVV
jgi:hypothetical protein